MKSFVLRLISTFGLGCAIACASVALAQSPAPLAPTPAAATAAPSTATAALAPATTAPASTDPELPLDRVIAVVNDEAVTQYDVDESLAKTIRQLNESKVPV